MTGIGLGGALARERLRGFAPWMVLALTALAVYAFAVLEHAKSNADAADSALEGAVFGLALPVIAYLVSERACGGERLDRSVDVLARHGLNRRAAMLGVLAASAVCAALAGFVLTLSAGIGARDTPRDITSSGIIALGAGATYALWFGAASLIGKRGGGRKWALILDFTLGAGSSVLALPFPRGHARNLLGGEPVLDIPQWAAWVALILIAALGVTRGVARTPR